MSLHFRTLPAMVVAAGIVAAAGITEGQTPASEPLPEPGQSKPKAESSKSRTPDVRDRDGARVGGIYEYAALQGPLQEFLTRVRKSKQERQTTSDSQPKSQDGPAASADLGKADRPISTIGRTLAMADGGPFPLENQVLYLANGLSLPVSISAHGAWCADVLRPDPIEDLRSLADELDPSKSGKDRPVDPATLADRLRKLAAQIEKDRDGRTMAARQKALGDVLTSVQEAGRNANRPPLRAW